MLETEVISENSKQKHKRHNDDDGRKLELTLTSDSSALAELLELLSSSSAFHTSF